MCQNTSERDGHNELKKQFTNALGHGTLIRKRTGLTKGLVLIAVNYPRYTFKECMPDEYNVRLKFLDNFPTHPESQQYINFMEETGAEYQGSATRWVYFRKKTTQDAFDLYSDTASRVEHLNRILPLLGIIGILPICSGISKIVIGFSSNATDTLLNFIIGTLSLCVRLFIIYGLLSVFSKKRKLQKQQNLFE